jgi:hypothetical protein
MSKLARISIVAMVCLAAVLSIVSLAIGVIATASIGGGDADLPFTTAIAILSDTAVVVAATILWRKPGNRIGLLLGVGGLLLLSVFAAWSIAFGQSDRAAQVSTGFATWWGTVALLPAITLLFPAVGIIFPDGRLPSRRWRLPVAAGTLLLATGTVLQTVAAWRLAENLTIANPLAIQGLPPDVAETGGGLAALGTFLLFAVAVAAVTARFRRSTGIEHAQQKWLVAGVGAMAVIFPLSFATNIGGDVIDLVSVAAGALVPIAVGIAVLRYHVFDIDRVVSRGIAYGLLTAVLVATYSAVILVLQGPLGAFLGGDTISVALSTLVVAALFQPVRRTLQRAMDRGFDRARVDADTTTAAFSERLRDEVDIAMVTADLDRTVRDAMRPAVIGLWLRNARSTTR